MGVSGQRHALAALPPGKSPGTHCTGGQVGLGAGMKGCGKSRPPPTVVRTLNLSTRSESLYQILSPGLLKQNTEVEIFQIIFTELFISIITLQTQVEYAEAINRPPAGDVRTTDKSQYHTSYVRQNVQHIFKLRLPNWYKNTH